MATSDAENLTDKQKLILSKMTLAGQGSGMTARSAGRILFRAGLLKPSGPLNPGGNYALAGYSVLNALENKNLAVHILSSRDQWAIKLWFLKNPPSEPQGKN